MNIRTAKKLYPNDIYLKSIIFHLKAGNRSKYKLAKGTHHSKGTRLFNYKLRSSIIKFFNKHLKRH